VEAAAKGTGSPDTVGTVGVCQVHPGAVNSVPSRVSFTVDIRDVSAAPRDAAVSAVRAAITEVSRRRGVAADVRTLNADPPAGMAATVVGAAESACGRLGLGFKRMPSRAYHDSLFMAQNFPTGMIFIPCRGGVSHRPDEYSSPDEIRRGVEVLALALAELAS
jgi:N-carbamoyl-L-amino-acid hydrolase